MQVRMFVISGIKKCAENIFPSHCQCRCNHPKLIGQMHMKVGDILLFVCLSLCILFFVSWLVCVLFYLFIACILVSLKDCLLCILTSFWVLCAPKGWSKCKHAKNPAALLHVFIQQVSLDRIIRCMFFEYCCIAFPI